MEHAGATFRVREPSVFAYFRFAAAMVFVATIVAISFAALLNRFLPLSASLALTSVPAVIIPALLVRRECRRAAERRAIRVTVDDRRVEWNPGDGSQPLGIDRAETGRITLDPEGMLRFQSSNSAWTFDLSTKCLEDGAAVIDRVRLWGQVDELRQTPFEVTEHIGRFIGGLQFCLAVLVGCRGARGAIASSTRRRVASFF
jgi:hypothetical protein